MAGPAVRRELSFLGPTLETSYVCKPTLISRLFICKIPIAFRLSVFFLKVPFWWHKSLIQIPGSMLTNRYSKSFDSEEQTKIKDPTQSVTQANVRYWNRGSWRQGEIGITLLFLPQPPDFSNQSERNFGRPPHLSWRQTECKAFKKPYDLHLLISCPAPRIFRTNSVKIMFRTCPYWQQVLGPLPHFKAYHLFCIKGWILAVLWPIPYNARQGRPRCPHMPHPRRSSDVYSRNSSNTNHRGVQKSNLPIVLQRTGDHIASCCCCCSNLYRTSCRVGNASFHLYGLTFDSRIVIWKLTINLPFATPLGSAHTVQPAGALSRRSSTEWT